MKSVFLLAAILVFLFFFIRFLEKKSLYFPVQTIDATPDNIGLDYEEIFVTTKDGVQLSAWFIPSGSTRATLLFSHGNGGNISHRLEKIKILNKLNLDVLIFDYRGYGMSKGSPSEKGLYRDAEAMYDFLIKERKISPRKIVGYGESLGGAVIINMAMKHEVGGLIIEDSFTSVRDMSRKYFPFIPSFVYKSKFDSLTKIKSIKAPKLILHSVNDEIVPFEQGKKLFENAPEPKGFVQLQGGHNDAFLISQDVFAAKIDSFIDMVSRLHSSHIE